jgi:hypothetical protein
MQFDVSIHHRDVLTMSRARTDIMLQHMRMRVRISVKSIRSIGMCYTWVGTAIGEPLCEASSTTASTLIGSEFSL